VISTFDTPGSLMVMGVGNWQVGGSPVPDTVIQRNATEGYSCPGSLEMMVPFTAYGTQSDAQINFSPVQNWVGYRKLHARVKIVMPSTGNLDHINGVQFAVNSDNYMNYDGKFTSASTFMDFGWHDIELDLTLGAAAPPPQLDSIIQVQVQLQTPMMAPAMGPAAPVPTTILVDDVWIE
jgi:hypothetical protein